MAKLSSLSYPTMSNSSNLSFFPIRSSAEHPHPLSWAPACSLRCGRKCLGLHRDLGTEHRPPKFLLRDESGKLCVSWRGWGRKRSSAMGGQGQVTHGPRESQRQRRKAVRWRWVTRARRPSLPSTASLAGPAPRTWQGLQASEAVAGASQAAQPRSRWPLRDPPRPHEGAGGSR